MCIVRMLFTFMSKLYIYVLRSRQQNDLVFYFISVLTLDYHRREFACFAKLLPCTRLGGHSDQIEPKKKVGPEIIIRIKLSLDGCVLLLFV
jgi:hypothetical protein